MNNEVWYDIPGFEGYYQFSTLDRVKSLERYAKGKNGSHRIIKEKIRKPQFSKGYWQVNLSKNNIDTTFGIHHIKAMVFIPNPNNYTEVLHIDDNPSNNALSNLKWGTHKQNIREAWKNGLCELTRTKSKQRCGEKCAAHKLTKEQVIAIRNKFNTNGYTMIALAKEYGVSYQSISGIIHKKKWKHLT